MCNVDRDSENWEPDECPSFTLMAPCDDTDCCYRHECTYYMPSPVRRSKYLPDNFKICEGTYCS